MSCGCGTCECDALRERNAALEAENAELSAHIELLVRLEESRHDAEKRFGVALFEARGRISERSVDL